MSRSRFELQGCPFKVGDRVRLNREGMAAIRPGTREEARDALDGVRIVAIEGPMTSGANPLYDVDLEGPLGAYLINTDWIERA